MPAHILLMGIVIQHNFIENHSTTDEVLSEKAGVNLNLGENRWLGLINLASIINSLMVTKRNIYKSCNIYKIMEKTESEFEVKEGRTTIAVPHQGKRITFVAPNAGPSTYDAVGKEIDSAGLLRPTFAETVSLVYSAAQNQCNKYAKQVIDILNNRWFWGFNAIRYEPKEGAFISDRNRKDVYVPFGFKTGEQSLDELVKNPFVLALAESEEGAEKLAKIVKSQKKIPYVWSYEGVDSTQNRVSALNSGGNGLYVDGYCYDCDCGCAFGVSE